MTSSPRETSDAPSLGVRAQRGARWQVTANGFDAVVTLGTLILLARLIAPDKFGLAALMIVVTSTLTLAMVTPVASAVIAKELVTVDERSTAFWLTVGPSFGLFVLALPAFFIVGLSQDVQVAAAVFAFSIPCLAAAQITTAVLQQDLAFRSLAAVRVASSGLGAVVTVAAALAGAGVVALAVRSAVVPLLVATLSIGFTHWTPRWVFKPATIRPAARYARGLLGFHMVNQALRKGDDLLIGLTLNSTALGLYSVAYRFIETPVSQAAQMATNVTFPIVVRIKDPGRFAAGFLRSQKILVYAIAPVSICSIALGDVGVPAVLGEEWTPAGPVVQIFGFIALLQTAETQSGVVFQARDATDAIFKFSLAAAPVFVTCLLIGVQWGIQGAAMGYLIYCLLMAGPLCVLVSRYLGVKLRVIVRSLALVLGVAVGAAAAGLLIQGVLEISSLWAISITGLLLSALYWVLCGLIDSDLREDVLRTIFGSRAGAGIRTNSTELPQ